MVIRIVSAIMIMLEQPNSSSSYSTLLTNLSFTLYATTNINIAWQNRKPIDINLATVIYPLKKSLEIHIVAINPARTASDLKPQHPSWKRLAAEFLARITQNINVCRHASTKLILIIIDGPKHAVPSPSAGHCRKCGSTSTKLWAVKSRMTANIIQKN